MKPINPVEYRGIAHASVLVRDTETALTFYCTILGMTPDPARPELGFPGAWLQVGGQQIHLLQLPNPDPVDTRPQHGGRDRHVAVHVADLDAVSARLDSAAIPYTRSRSGRSALFCRDPDGNAIEIIQVET